MLKLKKNAVGDLVKLIKAQPKADYVEFGYNNIDLKKVKKKVKNALKYADKNKKMRSME